MNTPNSAPEESNEKLVKKLTITISSLSDRLGILKEEKTLPNGRVVKTASFTPSHLPEVFRVVEEQVRQEGLGKNDVVVIDGGCPTWLLPTISHACHPSYTAVRYPQGGPEATLPVSGVPVEGSGSGENMEFEVTEDDERTLVEFRLTQRAIDTAKTIETLLAPLVTNGKPVFISGRGPIAISAGLAEAYAHRVPFVANYQPGTGFVVSISHDLENPYGKTLQAE